MGDEAARIVSLRGLKVLFLSIDADPSDGPWADKVRSLVRERLREADIAISEEESVVHVQGAAMLAVTARADLMFDQGPGIYLLSVTVEVNQFARLPSIECLVISWQTGAGGIGFRETYHGLLMEAVTDRLDFFIGAYRQANGPAYAEFGRPTS